jgi:peptidoglycan/xylan/chitin deacetylase (PgdA/CDA1 family)
MLRISAEMASVGAIDSLGAFAARATGAILSPAGSRARLLVLTYHRILAHRDPLLADEIDAATFDRHVALLTRSFRVLPLGRAVGLLQRGALPARAVALTFDDGYANNCEVALPILARHGASATFFVCTGFLDGGIMWNDAVIESIRQAAAGELDLRERDIGRFELSDTGSRRKCLDTILTAIKHRSPAQRAADVAAVVERCRAQLPRDLMMRSAQVVELRDAGMELGAHTVTHPILKSIPLDQARGEITTGREHLERLLGEPVAVFAYPNGRPGSDYEAQHVTLVRELGFEAAVSTARGYADAASDRFQLPRTALWGADSLRLISQLLRAWMAPRAVTA